MSGHTDFFEIAESFYNRAANKRREAREYLSRKFVYPESISASQESMEFSVKSIFLYLGEEYPRSHEFNEEQFKRIIDRIPESCQHHNFARLLILTRFWSKFYATAKYGNEKLRIGPERLFKEAEAKLALEHAGECCNAADGIRSWVYTRRTS